MKFVAIQYNTSEEYFNDKVTIYHIRNDEVAQQIVNDELRCFKDDDVIVYDYTIREATRDEIITYIEEEADRDDLMIIVESLLNL